MRKDGEALTQLPRAPPDNPAMRFHHLAPGHGVLEIEEDGSPFATIPVGAELELSVWWGGGERTVALWLLSQTGRALGWAVVGEA